MCSSLNIVFNLKQNIQHYYVAENDVRPAIDFKIIRLARVRFEFETPGVDFIHLAQDRDQWRALVNTVMNIRVP
jgi:hypothetical protein